MNKLFLMVGMGVLVGLLWPAVPVAVYADVDDFDFSQFSADYYLSSDDEGRATLRVEEHLVAEFPDFDQNKGLVRKVPYTYQGRPLSFELESVKRNGSEEPIYNTSRDSGHMVIETGTDDYLYGEQEYEFIYTMRDVILELDDSQEFFWDVNGTEWNQSFDEVEARVYLEDVAEDGFSGDIRCIQGAAGESETCNTSTENNKAVFESTRRLEPGENISIVLEFESSTFNPFDEGAAGVLRNFAIGISSILALISIVWAVGLRVRYRDSRRGQVIVPQYIRPPNISMLMVAYIYRRNKSLQKAVAAQIIDLAVRNKLAIVETEKNILGLFTQTQYEIELKDKDGLDDLEVELVEALFNDSDLGARYRVGDKSNQTSRRIQKLIRSAKKSVEASGYRYKVPGWYRPYVVAGISAFVGVGVSVEMFMTGFEDWRVIAGGASLVSVAVSVFLVGDGIRALSDKGNEVFKYIEGLKDYIELAEAERLRVLQSPQGAQTEPVDISNKEQVLHLFEKLLPFAVLFGQESRWSEIVGSYYEEAHYEPAWYGGSSGFNASNFASSVSSFSASTSSSSSGMSGGTSGGGGGGGGGGGR